MASILLSKNVGCEDIKQFTECFENFFTDDLTKTSLTAELEQLEKHKNVKKLITKLMGSTNQWRTQEALLDARPFQEQKMFISAIIFPKSCLPPSQEIVQLDCRLPW